MKFSIKDFFSKWDQIRSFLRIWSHLLKNSVMENFIFCAVNSKSNSSNGNDSHDIGKANSVMVIFTLIVNEHK